MPLTHVSVRPDRPDLVGECVFSEQWRDLMAKEPSWTGPLDHADPCWTDVFGEMMGEPDQRDATVAATFIQWLGTNVGYGFLLSAENLMRAVGASRPAGFNPYLALWASRNLRRSGVNFNLTLAELLLAHPSDDRGPHGFPTRPPDLSSRDLELMSRAAAWLDSDGGQAFLQRAKVEIRARIDAIVEHSAA